MTKLILAVLLFTTPYQIIGQVKVSQKAPSITNEQQISISEQELHKINKDFANALEKSDSSVLSRMYADDYAGIAFSGQSTTKAGMVASNNTATATLILYEEDDVKVRVYGDTAIVTSRALLKTRLNDDRIISRRNALTKIWVRRSGNWQIVATHMDAMPLPIPSLEVSKLPQTLGGNPWQNFGKIEQEVLEAHVNYLRQTTGPDEAQRRFASGYFTIANTGVANRRDEIIQQLKNNADQSTSTQRVTAEIVKEEKRVLIKASNSTLMLDDFLAQSYYNTVAISCRATNYNKNGQAIWQNRISAVYVKKNELWQQILGQSTEITAESTR